MASEYEGIRLHKQMAMTGKYPEEPFGVESEAEVQGDAHTPVSTKRSQTTHHPRKGSK